jgi:hypothetical protein
MPILSEQEVKKRPPRRWVWALLFAPLILLVGLAVWSFIRPVRFALAGTDYYLGGSAWLGWSPVAYMKESSPAHHGYLFQGGPIEYQLWISARPPLKLRP